MGTTVINAGIVREARKRRPTQIKKEKAEKELEENIREIDGIEHTIIYYNEWIKKGKPLDKNEEKIKLSTTAAKCIGK